MNKKDILHWAIFLCVVAGFLGLLETSINNSNLAVIMPVCTPVTEVCDGKDNNCDGIIDESCPVAKNVVGYLVYWDKAEGLKTINNNSDLTEVSPWAYIVGYKGDVVPDPTMADSIIDAETIGQLKARGLKVTPTVHNLISSVWNADRVSRIISSSTLVQTHINSIVNLVVSNGYDGIDIDYENLYAKDRANFTSFITRLANRLHLKGKTLSVVVYGKVDEPGWWSGPQSQDYSALGAAVDQMRIMYYQFDTSKPGAQSPLWWIEQSLAFAKTKIPAEKIVFGLDLGGADWSNGQPTIYTWREINALATSNGATVKWDSVSQSPWFTYPNHEVWFNNTNSTAYKISQAKLQGISSFYFWRLGREVPGVWKISI